MIQEKILIIDDEENIRSLLEDILEKENFTVVSCSNTEDGYKKSLSSKPDLIILDLEVPKIGGTQLCRLLRTTPQTKNIPVIMLTVASSETSKVIGFETGADDYITKPFSKNELVARIKAILKRVVHKPQKEVIRIDGLEMDTESMTVYINKKQVVLRHMEFKLLELFLRKPNKVLSRDYILETVFGYSGEISTRTVDTHVKNLRQHLGQFGKRIKTVFGCGFKFVPKNKCDETK